MNKTWDEGFSMSIQFESEKNWNCLKLNCDTGKIIKALWKEFNAIKKAKAKLNKVKSRKSSIA